MKRLHALMLAIPVCAGAAWAGDPTLHHVSRCYNGTELDQSSRVAIQAQKTAWDFVAKEFHWDARRRPKAVVCDLVWMLIVDYRPDNPRSLVTHVTLKTKPLEVVQVFMAQ